MSDTQADTTSMGLFLIAFIMLVFGLVGIFGFMESDFAGLFGATSYMMLFVGVLFAFVGWSMWKNGNKFLMIIFAFLALFALSYFIMVHTTVATLTGDIPLAFVDGIWLYFIVIGLFLIIFMIWTLLVKAGYMLALILLSAALVFIFFALICNSESYPGTFYLLLGVFSLIAFLLTTYMALNDVADLGLPVR